MEPEGMTERVDRILAYALAFCVFAFIFVGLVACVWVLAEHV